MVSFTLVLSNFDFNKKKHVDNSFCVENFVVTEDEFSSLFFIIKNKYPYLHNIVNINMYLKKIISDDLLFNIKINKLKIFISDNDVKNAIINEVFFLKDKKFSLDLYKKYLLHNNISDFNFQKIIEKGIVFFA